MTPSNFPQANLTLGPPKNLDESQCGSLPAYTGHVRGGPMDGADVVIVAWKPSDLEISQLLNGSPVFIGFIGAVPPHFVTSAFPE